MAPQVRCPRCGCESTRVKRDEAGRCLSVPACTKRLRERVGVRLELERDTPLDEDTLWALANIKESARVAREIRYAYYRAGLCTRCGVRLHTPGRTYCGGCR